MNNKPGRTMTDDRSRRKELQQQYRETRPEAGVYRIVNTATGRVLIGSSPNLAGVRNKLAFAQQTNTPSALDYRLADDVRRYGLDAFTFEVLDVVEAKPEMTSAKLRDELSALEALWRERTDPALLY